MCGESGRSILGGISCFDGLTGERRPGQDALCGGSIYEVNMASATANSQIPNNCSDFQFHRNDESLPEDCGSS
jgi:hypothetical protein